VHAAVEGALFLRQPPRSALEADAQVVRQCGISMLDCHHEIALYLGPQV